MSRKLGFISLGCPKNSVDSEVMLGILKSNGWSLTDNPEEAEVIVINTCGFILPAREEAIDTILESIELKKHGKCKKLIVTGCMVNRHLEEMRKELPEVDFWLDTNSLDSILQATGTKEASSRQHERLLLTPSHTAYLKIGDGCSHNCTFCTIPLIKGKQASRTEEEILEEAEDLACRGVKELILIAQDTSRWGKDLDKHLSLSKLLSKLASKHLFPWIRVMYLYPLGLTDELIETFERHESLLPYFDLPLQHSDESILKKMGRPGNANHYLKLLSKIRLRMPEAVFRSSFIVGFPGETDKSIENLKQFLSDAKLDNVGTFTYWHEEGTKAYDKYEDLTPQKQKNRWRDEIMEHQAMISRELLTKQVGKTLNVIVDGTHPESELLVSGRFYGQAPEIDGCVIITDGLAQQGDIVPVRIEKTWDYDLSGISLK